MAAAGRGPGPALIDALFAEPERFGFFQAVRILEWAGRREADDPRAEGRKAVGENAEPRREAVRFRALTGLSFPASEVIALHAPPAEAGEDPMRRRPPGPPAMTVGFMGLTGPSGVLPQHYTELMLRDLRSRSSALRDFMDLFNHRAVSLFVRAWEKYRLASAYERFGAGGGDPISRALYSLVGFGTPHLLGRLAADADGRPRIDDEALLHYSGHLAHWPRSAAALQAMLTDYFERPIRVEQFQGRWLELGEDERSLLPGPEHPEGRFCALGVDAVCGDRVWDVQSAFRLRIGPLKYDQFLRFMPDGDELARLAHLTRLYVGPAMSFDVQVTLRKEDVPDLSLGGEDGPAPRLGWNTWVKHEPLARDADDAVYLLDDL
jgi:type VI secretion system protein ImpH